MTIELRKYHLIRHLLKIEDEAVISKMEELVVKEIDAQEMRMIELGLKQIEEGKVMSNKSAHQKIKEFLDKKRT